MKRVLILLVIVALVLGVMAPVAMAKGHKVEFCHVNGSNGTWFSPFFGTDIQFGRVKSVSMDAYDAHMAHGDGLITYTADGNPILFFNATAAGAVGNGNCGFAVP